MPKLIAPSAVQLAAAFAASFPYKDGVDNCLILNDEFDMWAEQQGFYKTADDRTIRSSKRNQLRTKINDTASHPDFRRVHNQEPFHVAVKDFGTTLVRTPAKEAFDTKLDKVAQKVVDKALAQKRGLETLKGAVESQNNPSPMVLVYLELAIKEIDKYVRVIDFQATQTNLSIAHVKTEVEKLVATGQLSSDIGSKSQKLLGNDDTVEGEGGTIDGDIIH